MDSKNNLNNENNNEVDIISLLEYFKKGFSKINNSLRSFINYLKYFVVSFLILVKKNILLFLLGTLVAGVIGYLKNNVIHTSYNYEMIVAPRYNSAHDLYNLVDYYKVNPATKLFRYNNVEVEPVKSFNDAVNLYYKYIDGYSNDRDTIFYNEYTIKQFKENLINQDYPNQIVRLNIDKKISPNIIQDIFIKTLENNVFLNKVRNTRIKSLEDQYNSYKKALSRIDSLMKVVEPKPLPNTNINLSGEGKVNLEKDLSDEYKFYTNRIAEIVDEKALSENIINVVSPLKEIKGNGISQSPIYLYILFGFLFVLICILLVRLYKYLDKVEKNGNI